MDNRSNELKLALTPFNIERTFNVSAARLWSAVSDPIEMKRWYFEWPDFRPEPGFEWSFMGGPDDERQYKHVCKVLYSFPEKALIYSWEYAGYSGSSVVAFLIESKGEGKCSLNLSHQGLENFPKNEPDLAKENFFAGWREIMNSLEKYLGEW